MAELTIAVSYGLQAQTQIRNTPLTFGDDYEQRNATGINNIRRAYSVAFNQRSKEEAAEIVDFFKARKLPTGELESFDWTPPDDDTAGKFVCDTWNRIFVSAGKFNVSATFREVFEA